MKKTIQKWSKLWLLLWLASIGFHSLCVHVFAQYVGDVLGVWVSGLAQNAFTFFVIWRFGLWQLGFYRPPMGITYPKFPSYDRIAVSLIALWVVVGGVFIWHLYVLALVGQPWLSRTGWVLFGAVVVCIFYNYARIRDSLLPSMAEDV